MSFLLKIVEGPNKGAEVALPDGVAVTLGKADSCDIVLADATLPESPLSLEASASGVSLDGAPLPPFHVEKRGATAFAVGPADAPWGGLVWPKAEDTSRGAAEPQGENLAKSPQSREEETLRTSREKKHRGVAGLFAALALLLALAALAAWLLPRTSRQSRNSSMSSQSSLSSQSSPAPASSLSALAERLGLALEGGRLSGNFATRAERLAATAEAYAAQPGIELDFSDDESLRTAAEDTLSLVGETGLRVAAATNRVLVLAGTPVNLPRALEALAADLPRLRDVDVEGVKSQKSSVSGLPATGIDVAPGAAPRAAQPSTLDLRPSPPSLPVCGILTTPYPCLVLRNGARILEGAPLGEWTVAEIGADSVVLTNAERSVTWKP